MKSLLKFYIVALLTLVTFFNCCSSKVQRVKVDFYANTYVNQFEGDLKEFGIDNKVITDSIDDIVLYPLADGIYGFYSSTNRQIVINEIFAFDTIILKKIIYHELGHLYGLDHDSDGIMQTFLSPLQLHQKYNPTRGGSNKTWDIHKAYLFYRIKERLSDLVVTK